MAVELVATAHVEAGAQAGHGLGRRLAARNRIVGEHDMHEVVEVDVGFQAVVAIPNIKAIATR